MVDVKFMCVEGERGWMSGCEVAGGGVMCLLAENSQNQCTVHNNIFAKQDEV